MQLCAHTAATSWVLRAPATLPQTSRTEVSAHGFSKAILTVLPAATLRQGWAVVDLVPVAREQRVGAGQQQARKR